MEPSAPNTGDFRDSHFSLLLRDGNKLYRQRDTVRLGRVEVQVRPRDGGESPRPTVWD